MYSLKKKLRPLFRLHFKVLYMNLFKNKTIEYLNAKHPNLIKDSIKRALGANLENCDDLQDLEQDVYLLILEVNKDKDITLEQVLIDVKEMSTKVAHEYLKGKYNYKKLLEEYVA